MVVALIALFVALGGSAAALSGSNTVFSDDIVDNEVKTADVRDDTLTGGGLVSADVRNDTQTAPAGGLGAVDLKPSSVGSSEVTNGSIASGDLAPAARGARAYGRVDALGGLSRSKNVDSVSHPFTGVYCIDPAAGIDPASAVLVVASDSAGNATDTSFDDISVPEWNSAAVGCPAGTMQVMTFVYFGDATDDNDGSGTVSASGDDLNIADDPFTFLIP